MVNESMTIQDELEKLRAKLLPTINDVGELSVEASKGQLYWIARDSDVTMSEDEPSDSMFRAMCDMEEAVSLVLPEEWHIIKAGNDHDAAWFYIAKKA